MGTVQGGSFISAYLGNQIDALLAAMAQANPLPSGTNWIAFIDDCVAAQTAAETAASDASSSAASAEEARIAANSAKSAAVSSANDASASATQAANSAYNAGNSAMDASNSKTAAASSANSAANSATAASNSKTAAENSATNAESSASTASTKASQAATSAANAATSALYAAGYVTDAAASATNAALSVAAASTEATKSESWAVGGTGTRTGENTDNSKYYCELAQAAAEQASVPPIEGVYNIVVADRVVSGAKYALVVYSGRLKLVGVASATEATEMTLIDSGKGKNYTLAANNGRLIMVEV